jgi:hypothetical protein
MGHPVRRVTHALGQKMNPVPLVPHFLSLAQRSLRADRVRRLLHRKTQGKRK